MTVTTSIPWDDHLLYDATDTSSKPTRLSKIWKCGCCRKGCSRGSLRRKTVRTFGDSRTGRHYSDVRVLLHLSIDPLARCRAFATMNRHQLPQSAISALSGSRRFALLNAIQAFFQRQAIT